MTSTGLLYQARHARVGGHPGRSYQPKCRCSGKANADCAEQLPFLNHILAPAHGRPVDPERRAFPRLAVALNMPAMGFDESVSRGQTKACALSHFLLLPHRWILAMKPARSLAIYPGNKCLIARCPSCARIYTQRGNCDQNQPHAEDLQASQPFI